MRSPTHEIADTLRCYTRNDWRDLIDACGPEVADLVADAFHVEEGDDADELRSELRAAEDENAELSTEVSKLESDIEELQDRLTELEDNPADCVQLVWDLARADPKAPDALALFAQLILRAGLVAPDVPPFPVKERRHAG